MVPLSVSDIVKLLEQIPGWKSVMALPKRLAEIEGRLTALEKGGPARSGPRPTECTRCGATMTFQSERPHPHFDFAGMKTHQFRCDGCGFETTKEWRQDKGYG